MVNAGILVNMDSKEFQQDLFSAFIDSNISGNPLYKPYFVSNDYHQGKKVLTYIEHELKQCDSFDISVAFITESGITPLLSTLKDLERKGIKGRIITTDYLSFSQPKALKRLHDLTNIELRMFMSNNTVGFHTKGYIFTKDNMVRMIVGSSNLTNKALTVNKEWNSRIVSSKQGEYAQSITKEFDELWNSEDTKSYDDFIDLYESQYTLVHQRDNHNLSAEHSANIPIITPNRMQTAFINNLKKLITDGAKKALLISATGTGKTFASAFALKELGFRKALFVVHREQIATKSLLSYQVVFGQEKTYGLLSGNSKQTKQDIIFSTMQTLCKDEIIHQFRKDEFDIIVIDECHRSGANSYQKIMNYFIPQLYLGMSASPDRTDGFDVYSLFDHNIAYEIRLQDALKEDLLCPFHYFGIKDIYNDETKYDLSDFKYLTSSKRIEYVIEQIQYYGYYGNKVKGLVFCSRKEEARRFSIAFNQKGYKTVALTGEDSIEYRQQCVTLLESDDDQNYLDYIFTVDIFNEGIDIPSINQVVMLRETQSAIIFVQQLGRGLRKAKNKEFVVILDFIGNYDNNYLIPTALSGDYSYNKDNMRRYVLSGERIIPGCSTIHFDEVSQKRIFEAIDKARLNKFNLLKESYLNLKYKLNRIPSLIDFDLYDAIDPLKIFDSKFQSKPLGNYHQFLQRLEHNYDKELSPVANEMLTYISQKFACGKRIEELLFLEWLLYQDVTVDYPLYLKQSYKIECDDLLWNNLINQFSSNFLTGSAKDTFKNCVFIRMDDNGYVTKSLLFDNELKDSYFYKLLLEVIEFGKRRYLTRYTSKYLDTSLVLYEKYTYEQVCRYLNWAKAEVAQNIGGYKYDQISHTFPIFINYQKDENISESIQYEDQFVSNNELIHYSKNKRSLTSPDVQKFINANDLRIKVHLFVRKNKDDNESKEFYYLGLLDKCLDAKEVTMKSGDKAVQFKWHLKTNVRDDIYSYITEY